MSRHLFRAWQLPWLLPVMALWPAGAQTRIDLKTQGKAVDFAEATLTRPNRMGPALPSSCTTGETFFLTTAEAGANLYGCKDGVWRVTGGGGVASVFGRAGVVTAQTGDYSFSQISGMAAITQGGTGATTAAGARTNLGAAAASHSHALTDLTGITGKQGDGSTLLSFGGGTTAEGECAQFDSAGNVVSTGGPCGRGEGPSYAVAFSSETSKTITAATHGFDTANLFGACYDTTVTPAVAVDGYSMSVNQSTYQVVFTFPSAFTGTCIINAGGSGTGGGDTVEAGEGITVSGSGTKTIAVDTAVVPSYLQGSFSGDISTIANGACGQKSFSMSGAVTGMTGLVAVNTPFAAGVNLQLAKVPSSGTVIVEMCNLSGSSYTPTIGLTYTVTLIGTF
ncbi:MAG: hypothetical protein IT160_12830 [Bryobacterales bacterium]|nr:hypothetical protein [Bryobacterales bacterium]